jgi:uncharacterized protein
MRVGSKFLRRFLLPALPKFLWAFLWAFLWLGSTGSSAEEISGRNIAVFGDSLADGVWSGLYPVLKTHPEDRLFRHSKVGAGLTRGDYQSWLPEFTAALDDEHITVAVLMFGANDQQNIRDDNRKGWLFQTDGWKQVYSARLDAILAELTKRKIAVLWLGLPVMRKDEMNKGAAYLNRLFADAVSRSGATFLPLGDDFKDKDGGFSAYLPDATGRLRQIRQEDGVHFTGYGYELIGAKVYGQIVALRKRSTAQASIP